MKVSDSWPEGSYGEEGEYCHPGCPIYRLPGMLGLPLSEVFGTEMFYADKFIFNPQGGFGEVEKAALRIQ